MHLASILALIHVHFSVTPVRTNAIVLMVQCTCTYDNGNNNTKFTGDFGMYYLAGENYTCTRKS